MFQLSAQKIVQVCKEYQGPLSNKQDYKQDILEIYLKDARIVDLFELQLDRLWIGFRHLRRDFLAYPESSVFVATRKQDEHGVSVSVDHLRVPFFVGVNHFDCLLQRFSAFANHAVSYLRTIITHQISHS